MLFLDPPYHTRVRSIFTRAFTPRTLESLRPRIEEVCDEQLEKMAASSERQADLMKYLAAPLPVMVIAELLGFPPADYVKLKKWSDDMTEALGFMPSEEAKFRARQAQDEMRGYFFANVVARLRRTSGSIIEASMDLGADGWQTFRFVTMPSIATALVAGALLAFALSFDEIIVTNFLSGAELTLPKWIFNAIRLPRNRPVANAVALIVIVLSLIPVYFAQRLANPGEPERAGR